MARLKRLVLPDEAHHLVLRGGLAGPVFADAEDCARYLALLAQHSRRAEVAVHAFALVPDQVNLLCTPRHAQALGSLMQSLGRSYTANFNRRHGRVGPMWRGRFQAVPVEPGTELIDHMRFIEQIPVRRGLAESARDYAWSSAAHHVGLATFGWLTDHPSFWQLGNTPFDRQLAYAMLVQQSLGATRASSIEQLARKGWVSGSPDFIADIVSQAGGRRVTPLKSGRPKKIDAR